jgi:hypothetical protein
MRPWAADDRTLALMTWTVANSVCLYDVEERKIHQAPTGGALPHSVQWAPNADRLLLPFSTGGQLHDATGKRRAVAEWNVDPEPLLYTDWTRWGLFFVIARQSPGSTTRLAFHDGMTGQLVEAIDLDPIDLVPYNSGAYARIPRSGCTLALRSGVRAAGFLLDTWHDARFDAETGTLRLATYRPVSEPYSDQLACDVEARWIAVSLAA